MIHRQPNLRWWLIGLGIFVVVIALGVWLRSASAYGIVDHQLAGTAQQVDIVQAGWRADGVRWLAMLSMVVDLIFIGVYSLGAWIAGRGFSSIYNHLIRVFGWIIAFAAALFAFTDYVETGLQFAQLVREQGVGWMAQTAAAMQTVKVASFLTSLLGIIAVLILRRFAAPGA